MPFTRRKVKFGSTPERRDPNVVEASFHRDEADLAGVVAPMPGDMRQKFPVGSASDVVDRPVQEIGAAALGKKVRATERRMRRQDLGGKPEVPRLRGKVLGRHLAEPRLILWFGHSGDSFAQHGQIGRNQVQDQPTDRQRRIGPREVEGRRGKVDHLVFHPHDEFIQKTQQKGEFLSRGITRNTEVETPRTALFGCHDEKIPLGTSKNVARKPEDGTADCPAKRKSIRKPQFTACK